MNRSKSLKVGIILCFLAALLAGCTDNQRAKKWGGSATENLPAGKKLVTVTWKDSNMWILIRDMHANEFPETYQFKESSNWGMLEGTVIIKESK